MASVLMDDMPQMSTTGIDWPPDQSEVIEISSDEEDELNNPSIQDASNHGTNNATHLGAYGTSARTTCMIDLTFNSRQQASLETDHVHPFKKRKLSHRSATTGHSPSESRLLHLDGFIPPALVDSDDIDKNNSFQHRSAGYGPSHEAFRPINIPRSTAIPAAESSNADQKRRQSINRQASSLLKTMHTFGKQPKHAPYYDDKKLGVRMYRGPGSERFPVPLENAQHQMICDLWDQKQLKKAKQQVMLITDDDQVVSSGQTTIAENETTIDMEEPSEVDEGDMQILVQVLEVLPDVSHRFVLDLLELMTDSLMDDIKHVPNPNDILARIMELGDYPKERTRSPQALDTGSTIRISRKDNDKPDYLRNATILLAEEFDFVPTHFIQKAVREHQTLHAAFLLLYQHETAYRSSTETQRPYKRLRQPRIYLEKKYTPKPNSRRDRAQWQSLIIEMQAAKQHVTRLELKEKESKDKEAAEIQNVQDHIARGEVVECQCCFDDEVPTNRTVTCQAEQAHQYCFQCVERLAGSNTGSGKHEMLCMSQCGCKSPLDPDGVLKAVPTSILRKLASNQQHAEVDAAGIEGLEKCPHCDFKGICDPIDVDPVFSCMDPECGRVTCRVCFAPAHSPKTCEQVKKEQGLLQSRHVVEEARSLAMMRTCPRCKKKTIKESGCNKVTCTCGCMSCYVCQKDITKETYRHFGIHPKCPQQDSFDRHQVDADEAERATIDKIRAENPEYDERELTMDGKKQSTSKKRTNPYPRNDVPEAWHQEQGFILPQPNPNGNQNRGQALPPGFTEQQIQHMQHILTPRPTMDDARDFPGGWPQRIDMLQHILQQGPAAAAAQPPPPPLRANQNRGRQERIPQMNDFVPNDAVPDFPVEYEFGVHLDDLEYEQWEPFPEQQPLDFDFMYGP